MQNYKGMQILKILKNVEPKIRTYLGEAFCFSIIGDEAFRNGWVYDKYVDIEYTAWDRHIKYWGYDYYDFASSEVFIKSFTQIPIVVIDEMKICSLIENMINNDEYFVGFWNETIIYNYFEGTLFTEEFEHLCFIYGYDPRRRLFYSQGYAKDGKWKRFTLPYGVVVKALLAFKDKEELGFNGYQVMNNVNWNANKDAIVEKLNCFFEGDNRNVEAEYHFFRDVLAYGTIHRQSIYCIYEHKKLMMHRINYLAKEGIIDSSYNDIFSKYHKLVNASKNLLLLSIKYQTDNSMECMRIILKNAKKMIQEEKRIMEDIIKALHCAV